MKKVFFYAVLFAATSMTFVACGKKENKDEKKAPATQTEESEGEDKQDCQKADEKDCGKEANYGDYQKSEYSEDYNYGTEDSFNEDFNYGAEDSFNEDFNYGVEEMEEPVAAPTGNKAARAEAAVRAIEAATSPADLQKIGMEYSDLDEEDFTPAQQARMQKAMQKLGF